MYTLNETAFPRHLSTSSTPVNPDVSSVSSIPPQLSNSGDRPQQNCHPQYIQALTRYCMICVGIRGFSDFQHWFQQPSAGLRGCSMTVLKSSIHEMKEQSIVYMLLPAPTPFLLPSATPCPRITKSGNFSDQRLGMNYQVR